MPPLWLRELMPRGVPTERESREMSGTERANSGLTLGRLAAEVRGARARRVRCHGRTQQACKQRPRVRRVGRTEQAYRAFRRNWSGGGALLSGEPAREGRDRTIDSIALAAQNGKQRGGSTGKDEQGEEKGMGGDSQGCGGE